ncbi:hypothetical protein ACUHMQ_08030 [Chitinimonas sp. PSY-7]|uniref:hypothetical protein n=1 Tax=Chitinimonas sp. PSY-7 TaxID=3459088 RepID=UPI00403FDA6E
MKIQQSQVQLAGQRTAAHEHRVQEKLHVEVRVEPPRENTPDSVTLSPDALAAQQHDNLLDLRSQLLNHPLWRLIQELIKKLTGQEIDINDIVPIGSPAPDMTPSSPPAQSQAATPPQITWQIEHEYQEERRETEATRFEANGTATTQDGRQFKFDTVLNLYREFTETTKTRFSIGNQGTKRDPLVLNYSTASATLTQDKFNFDLDADGTEDNISFVSEGSGFLALDKNNDGIVNDGQELFGTQNGNGFTDLARYDDDGNGWIDETDSVWKKLSLWIRDADGKNRLLDLATAGIGALHLGYADTDFSLRDQTNREHGQIRRSGLYLAENGQLGTLQQVDLVT